MKKLILDFLKGIPIGIANVIPGFSGGTMAVILNVYERLIAAISDALRRPFKALKEAGALFLGVLAGVVIAVELIVFLLENFPIPTTMFFVGLIIGSIPNIRAKAGQNKIKPADVAAFFICVTVIIVFSFIKGKTPSAVDYDFKIALLIFFLSVIAAAAMIIPGVSGSLVFLAFGYYDFIWKDLMGNFINAVIGFNISGAVNGFVRLLPFILGVAAGIILIAKAIKFLFAKRPQTVYYAIFGLLIASPFAIIYGMYREYRTEIIENNGFWEWAVGVLAITASAYLVNYLSRFDEKKNNGAEEKS
jgi:putative membrane protein